MDQWNAFFDRSVFQDNYAFARQTLLSKVSSLPAFFNIKHHLFTHPLTGPDGEKLCCDVLELSASKASDNVLVLVSGTHGVEGFVGSAVQQDILRQLEQKSELFDDVTIVLVHALNPWGFAWLRRVDHEGVDINRNFVDFGQPLPESTRYDAIQHLINEQANVLLADPSLLVSLWQDKGVTTFSEALTEGQYQHQDGIYFGGYRESWSREVMASVSKLACIQNAQSLCVIDLHTGLGPYGYGEVINDHCPETLGFVKAINWFGHNASSAHLGSSFSTPKLGLLDYFWHDVIKERGCFVTLEFGTFAFEQLIVSLLREQLYQQQSQLTGGRELTDEVVQSFKNFFYPAEVSWQQSVLFRARQVIRLAVEGMKKDG